ncbi:MAG: hypothetical protein FWD96_06630 [Defluviitaleaceae bacterium]|nr:hypothetical protein [Defluviitaleaceae bacterium]
MEQFPSSDSKFKRLAVIVLIIAAAVAITYIAETLLVSVIVGVIAVVIMQLMVNKSGVDHNLVKLSQA